MDNDNDYYDMYLPDFTENLALEYYLEIKKLSNGKTPKKENIMKVSYLIIDILKTQDEILLEKILEHAINDNNIRIIKILSYFCKLEQFENVYINFPYLFDSVSNYEYYIDPNDKFEKDVINFINNRRLGG